MLNLRKTKRRRQPSALAPLHAAFCVACVGQIPPAEPSETPIALADETSNDSEEIGAEANEPSGPGSSTDSPEAEGKRLPIDSPEANQLRLPPVVIQRIVRAAFDEFRACYEAGLARDPRLEGMVTVRFVIGRQGLVMEATEEEGCTLDDPEVRTCIVKTYRRLRFPKPEGGTVTVVYPITFSLGHQATGNDDQETPPSDGEQPPNSTK